MALQGPYIPLNEREASILQAISEFASRSSFVKGKSNFPYSLLLGLAGDISFRYDLLDPATSAFPGYEL